MVGTALIASCTDDGMGGDGMGRKRYYGPVGAAGRFTCPGDMVIFDVEAVTSSSTGQMACVHSRRSSA